MTTQENIIHRGAIFQNYWIGEMRRAAYPFVCLYGTTGLLWSPPKRAGCGPWKAGGWPK